MIPVAAGMENNVEKKKDLEPTDTSKVFFVFGFFPKFGRYYITYMVLPFIWITISRAGFHGYMGGFVIIGYWKSTS